jgi:hypothetical protein
MIGFMYTNIDTVKKGIEDSLLLSPERKKSLGGLLADLSPEGLMALGDLLQEEPARITHAMEKVIGHAISEGNAEWLKDLERYLRTASRSLNRVNERAAGKDETEHFEHFFDAAA